MPISWGVDLFVIVWVTIFLVFLGLMFYVLWMDTRR